MLRLEQRHACASENKRRQKGQAPTTADLECEPSPGAQQQRQQPGRNGKRSESSGRCASRIRSRRRRMASVPGQTELMRLRTAGAAATSPKKATSNVVEPGNDAQGTQSKDRLLLTPLRVRAAVSAYPLRVRQKSGSGSPTWRESEKGHGSKDIPSRLQDKGRIVMDILEAAQGSSLSRKRRATEDEEVEPESPSKRSRHREVSLSPSNPFSDLRLPTTSTPARRMNLFAASTSSDGVFQLTRLPRVGTPGTPERRLQNRLCAPTPTCISAVGNLPEFPVGYYFGGLEGAIEGLAPFLGVGGRGRQAARASTKESVVKRSVPGVFENAGEDGGEHRGSVEK
ncbi:hypothetical protein MPH_06356 [Macrophomina phaseolina MS6]|uniref:Uncharacterized protein n=1 Tax=Macrophomina phaseolina (strain MS6) TaxID=1126212 RepID=K2RUJ1_MACPH|nr:hypothetical protein MPH_06356 [Macrophomina phaseolina MS6]